jgi:hypothetical protein
LSNLGRRGVDVLRLRCPVLLLWQRFSWFELFSENTSVTAKEHAPTPPRFHHTFLTDIKRTINKIVMLNPVMRRLLAIFAPSKTATPAEFGIPTGENTIVKIMRNRLRME